MSKAEEQALEAYPIKNEWIGNQYGVYGDINEDSREKFIQGYKQAIKDIKEWIDNNLSGYITNDGDWADIEHNFKEEFGNK